jgi:ATP-dependent Clp protease, protease subunit
MKTFWEFKAAAPKKAELYLYGEIGDSTLWGDEITPSSFAKDLAALGQIEQIDVFINSPGGSVFAGIAIYNILKRHEARVTVHVDGIAASAASIVAMAGDKIVVPKAATLMIHNAWGIGMGNKKDLRGLADELERLDGQLADIYAGRTGNDREQVAAWMEAERWMSGEEALADGFADELEEGKQIAACADLDKYAARYKNVPPMRAAVQAVEVVYGPPCSGKSTYVRENMGENDIVYDYDSLIKAMTTQEKRSVEKTAAHDIAIGIRGLMINRVKEETPVAKAWIITRWPSDALREKLEGLSVTMTPMDADKATCLQRLEGDETREDKDGWKAVIEQWFADHGEPQRTDNGAETQPVADSSKQSMADQRRRFDKIKRKILEV